MPLTSRFSLVSLLIVVAVAELILNRIGLPLIMHRNVAPWMEWLVNRGGLYAFYATATLALCTVCWATIVLVRDGTLLKPIWRILLTLAGASFLAVSGLAILVRLPATLNAYLNISFAMLLILLIAITVAQPINIRIRLGVTLIGFPLLLHSIWLLTQQVPAVMPQGSWADLPSRLYATGESMVFVNAFFAFFLFTANPIRSSRRHPFVFVMAASTAATLIFFAKSLPTLTNKLLYYGFKLHLPPAGLSPLWPLYLLAVFLFASTVLDLMLRRGPSRSLGAGLMLIALGGFHLQLSHQLLLPIAGLIQLLRSGIAFRQPKREIGTANEDDGASELMQTSPVADEFWNDRLTELARSCSDPGAPVGCVLLHSGATRIARARGLKDDRSFTIRVELEGGAVRQFEILIGQPGRSNPPASLTRVRHRRGRRVGSGTGPRDRNFDDQFTLRDKAHTMAELLSATAIAPRITALIHGHLAMWPGEGMHYRAKPDDSNWPLLSEEPADEGEKDSADEARALLALLLELDEQISGRAV